MINKKSWIAASFCALSIWIQSCGIAEPEVYAVDNSQVLPPVSTLYVFPGQGAMNPYDSTDVSIFLDDSKLAVDTRLGQPIYVTPAEFYVYVKNGDTIEILYTPNLTVRQIDLISSRLQSVFMSQETIYRLGASGNTLEELTSKFLQVETNENTAWGYPSWGISYYYNVWTNRIRGMSIYPPIESASTYSNSVENPVSSVDVSSSLVISYSSSSAIMPSSSSRYSSSVIVSSSMASSSSVATVISLIPNVTMTKVLDWDLDGYASVYMAACSPQVNQTVTVKRTQYYRKIGATIWNQVLQSPAFTLYPGVSFVSVDSLYGYNKSFNDSTYQDIQIRIAFSNAATNAIIKDTIFNWKEESHFMDEALTYPTTVSTTKVTDLDADGYSSQIKVNIDVDAKLWDNSGFVDSAYVKIEIPSTTFTFTSSKFVVNGIGTADKVYSQHMFFSSSGVTMGSYTLVVKVYNNAGVLVQSKSLYAVKLENTNFE